jgi:hypothetical protein
VLEPCAAVSRQAACVSATSSTQSPPHCCRHRHSYSLGALAADRLPAVPKMVAMWRPLTLNPLTTTIVAPPSNASKWQMGFNSAFKGLGCVAMERHLNCQYIFCARCNTVLLESDRSLTAPECAGSLLPRLGRLDGPSLPETASSFSKHTVLCYFRSTPFLLHTVPLLHLSIRTALQTTLQFAGYLRHYYITA